MLRTRTDTHRPAWRVTLGLLLTMCLLVGGIVPALAATDTPVRPNFELEGNVVNDPVSAPPDWESFFNVAPDGTVSVKSTLPLGFTAATFAKDFITGNSADTTPPLAGSTYSTGSKDTLNINPGWQCGNSNNLGDKTDMLNAYAAIYQPNPTDDLVVYYGLERASNTGSGNVGFWFLQDSTVSCNSSTGTATFTGTHTNGDILVVSEFSVGGAISTIKVFAWQFGATNPPNLVLLGEFSTPEPKCSASALASPFVCAIVNTGLISTPWLTQPKDSTLPRNLPSGFAQGHTLAEAEFYEGGINITKLLGATPCFAKFAPDTRSSPSETATLSTTGCPTSPRARLTSTRRPSQRRPQSAGCLTTRRLSPVGSRRSEALSPSNCSRRAIPRAPAPRSTRRSCRSPAAVGRTRLHRATQPRTQVSITGRLITAAMLMVTSHRSAAVPKSRVRSSASARHSISQSRSPCPSRTRTRRRTMARRH